MNIRDSSRIIFHKSVPAQELAALGGGIAIGLGVLAVLERLLAIYQGGTVAAGYGLMLVLAVPMLLTYTERVEALRKPGGLYGLMRSEYGLTVGFLVGWLELAGYAVVLALLARTIAVYGLAIYQIFGGPGNFDLRWIALGVILVALLLEGMPWRWPWRLSMFLIYGGWLLLAGLGIYSLMQSNQATAILTTVPLRNIQPLKLAAMLIGSLWGIVLVIGMRERMPQREPKALVRAQGIMLLMVTVLGILLAIATIPNPPKELSHVLTIHAFSVLIFQGEPVLTMLIGMVVLATGMMGISRGFRSSMETMSLMTEDAYFPAQFNYRIRNTILPPFLFVGILAGILILSGETIFILGMGAAFLLAVTLFIHFPEVLRPAPRLPEKRPIRLPYHPLFPALTGVVAVIGLVNLPPHVLKWSGIWLGIGVLTFASYGYRSALRKRGAERTFAQEKQEPTPMEEVSGPTVLALIRGLEDLAPMITVGEAVARRWGGRLDVMQILTVPRDVPSEEIHRKGEEAWQALAAALADITLPQGVEIHIMVRLTEDPIRGVIDATQERGSEGVVLLPPDFVSEDPIQNLEEYDAILRESPGHILFLNAFPPSQLRHITVLVGQGSQARLTLPLAYQLLSPDGILEIVHVMPPQATAEEVTAARERLHALLQEQGIPEERAHVRILSMDSMKAVVKRLVESSDLLILGASKNFMTRRATFAGINAEIFQQEKTPVILARAHETLRFAWISRLWESLTRPLPRLTLAEREAVVREILAGADPSVDFFILILLSSGIAMYGLLQNSGAVIIGAMLVAPLMSPIIAIAMSMVRGDLRSLRLSAQSTAQGVLLAITVGAVLTFFSPIKDPTREIMGRVSPNLLDLGIAFLSGAAGGYAMSRKNIAAALPGVAIAAALVPPLATVGFGFATADLSIALGALLLFITNLIAIVLAASLVFLALDFLTPERQSWKDVMRGLRITAVFLIVVMVILGGVTFTTVRKQRQLKAIKRVLTQNLYAKSFEPLQLDIRGNRHGYVIQAMLLSYAHPLSAEEVDNLNKALTEAVGAPVSIDLTVISAEKDLVNMETAVTEVRLEEALRQALENKPLQILDITVDSGSEGYQVHLTLLEFESPGLSAKDVASLEASLSQQFDSPVHIQVTAIPAEQIKVISDQ